MCGGSFNVDNAFWVNPFSVRAGLRALNGSPEGRIRYLMIDKTLLVAFPPRRFAMLQRWLICVFSSAALSVSAHAGDKPNPATTPVPRDANWVKRHEGFVEIAKKGGVDLLFLGDSITDAWGGEGHNPKAAGAKYFTEHFVPLKAANFGIGGDRTQHVLWRITNGELDGITPKVVVLMIGTNNTGSDSAEQIAEGITAIVKTIRARSPQSKVLLLAVFPRGEKPDNPARAKIAEINQRISRLDDGRNVRYLDIGKKFLQPDGTLGKDIMPDFLHLSARGYEIWGEAIQPTVQQMLASQERVVAEEGYAPAPSYRRVGILRRILRR
jgi:lysophospholipase L1-like esterase